MKRMLLLGSILFAVCTFPTLAQEYTEAPNPVATQPTLWSKVKTTQISWGSTDVRYKKEEPAAIVTPKRELTLTAWKGESVSAQLVISTPQALNGLQLSVSALTGGKQQITDVRTAFVRYVITDEIDENAKSQCGNRIKEEHDSTLVADVIDHITNQLAIEANTTRGGWITVNVPRDINAGKYQGTVTVSNEGQTLSTLKLNVVVKNRTLPTIKDWAFHLDLWQNPYAEARFYNVPLFTKEHFDLMRPDIANYVNAGGKVITASIIHKPWNGQTEDPFESMVTWLKKADGTWYYDYTVFDKWVEFMMSCGVTKMINCYSMIPWRLSFQYLDQASNSFKTLEAKPGDEDYAEFWIPMLKDFAAHLKTKGWFNITHIAMDERPMEAMLATLKVIKTADKDWKVSLAGTYHDELVDELDDYCITLGEMYPEDVRKARQAAGKNTTYYTCCAENHPNTFTASPAAEAECLAWIAAKRNLDGYLRWALNSWVKDPLLDTRFRSWTAGDTYIIYPYGRSSIRMERLKEGVQAYEKIRILREEFTAKGNKQGLAQIEKILSNFDDVKLLDFPAEVLVNRAKTALNKL